MEKFKVGDLVYDFRKGGAICKVVRNPFKNAPYDLMTIGDNGVSHTYTEDGFFSVTDQLPSLVKVNKENREALISIFGDVFQTNTPQDDCDTHLTSHKTGCDVYIPRGSD